LAQKKKTTLDVESLGHPEATRRNNPTAEQQSFVTQDEARPKQLRYPRNTALDPQLVWRGKDEQDSGPLTVPSVPIYTQEKIHPEALIADLKRRTEAAREEAQDTPDLFADAYPPMAPEDAFEFYQHEGRWQNRMVLGDSLLVMTSLAEKEALRGQVQCIYMDPPYGIKFNSNWQPSTKTNSLSFEHGFNKLTKAEIAALSDHEAKAYREKLRKLESGLSREPEMIRAFRDTWKDSIHSYLSYLRDRLTVCQDLLSPTGSIFVQIGEENLHLVRALLDEIFGRANFIVCFSAQKTGNQTGEFVQGNSDFILWFAKDKPSARSKFSPLFKERENELNKSETSILDRDDYSAYPLTSDGYRASTTVPFLFEGMTFHPGSNRHWGVLPSGLERAARAYRIIKQKKQIRMRYFFEDYPVSRLGSVWTDVGGATDKIYVVQSPTSIVERCILMSTDPGDLVLDPTCGSGTTAYIAEQWGRRWITIDTSRVALALARQRLMAGRFNAWLLQDTAEGATKEGEITDRPPTPERLAELTRLNRRPRVREGFVLKRVPHLKLSSIAENEDIDTIWEAYQQALAPLLERLNVALEQAWDEWEVPRDPGEAWPAAAAKAHAEARAALAEDRDADAAIARLNRELGRAYTSVTLPEHPRDPWPEEPTRLYDEWWAARRARQAEIDASITRNADTEYLVDKPYEAKGRVRVCGPFTVESLSPHRVLATDDEEEAAMVEAAAEAEGRLAPRRTKSLTRAEAEARAETDFVRVVLENLKESGVQNTKKDERLEFTELKPRAGSGLIAAEGRYLEGDTERRAAVVIGPEYGTVGWGLVRDAAREAVEMFDTLVICGFAFEPQVNEESFTRLGRLNVLKARMNSDLHMAGALKPTGAGNLFVVFGEPDVKVRDLGTGQVEVEIMGLDVFDPTTGEVRSSDLDDIACWFLDTDYDGDSFFVRHAYFLGGNDPYSKLKTTLKADIDADAWDALYSATSRPFPAPTTDRIAVKVINHYGDEVMKVFQKGRDW
jgi:adenine-specific DNA-methyltransferase